MCSFPFIELPCRGDVDNPCLFVGKTFLEKVNEIMSEAKSVFGEEGSRAFDVFPDDFSINLVGIFFQPGGCNIVFDITAMLP